MAQNSVAKALKYALLDVGQPRFAQTKANFRLTTLEKLSFLGGLK